MPGSGLPSKVRYYRSLFDAAGDAIIVCTTSGAAIECNQAALDLLRCTRKQLLGTTPVDWSPEFQPCGGRSAEMSFQIIENVLGGEFARFDWQHIRADGTPVTVEVTVRATALDAQQVFVVVSRDISDLKVLERERRLSEEKFSKAFKGGPDPIILSEIETGYVREINPAFTDTFGYTEAEAIGRTTLEIGLWADEKQRLQTVALMREKGYLRNHEVDFRTKDGRLLTVLGSSTHIDIDNKPFWLVQFRDITELKRLRTELEKQAHTDFLTGLATRGFFLDLANSELARARRYAKPLSLLMLDVDHFKLFNDTHGHLAGDEALRCLSRICQDVLREVDIVGRFGGEEFAIFLPETSVDQAWEVAERLRGQVAQTPVIWLENKKLAMTISVGVTELQPADTDLDHLFARADQALYEAKNKGRNQVRVEPALAEVLTTVQ